MRFITEVLPGIVAGLIVIALTVSLIRTHRRALKAEERADGSDERAAHSESQMALVMKFRGMKPADLDRLAKLDNGMKNGS